MKPWWCRWFKYSWAIIKNSVVKLKKEIEKKVWNKKSNDPNWIDIWFKFSSDLLSISIDSIFSGLFISDCFFRRNITFNLLINVLKVMFISILPLVQASLSSVFDCFLSLKLFHQFSIFWYVKSLIFKNNKEGEKKIIYVANGSLIL